MRFKVGDKVKKKDGQSFFTNFSSPYTEGYHLISAIADEGYFIDTTSGALFVYESEIELVASESQPKLGGVKHDEGKPDYSLLPLIATEEVVKVWTFGKKKYAAWNWTKGFVWSRPLAAAIRHIFSWASGQSKDPETGLSHLAHAICCLTMLLEFEATGTGEDDRRITYKPEGKS